MFALAIGGAVFMLNRDEVLNLQCRHGERCEHPAYSLTNVATRRSVNVKAHRPLTFAMLVRIDAA